MNREMLEAKWSEILDRAEGMLLPAHMHGAVKRWLWDGILPGDFLSAVLVNDLRGAALAADQCNTNALAHWARFFVWYMPSACWGSQENVSAWAAEGGWNGMLKTAEDAS